MPSLPTNTAEYAGPLGKLVDPDAPKPASVAPLTVSRLTAPRPPGAVDPLTTRSRPDESTALATPGRSPGCSNICPYEESIQPGVRASALRETTMELSASPPTAVTIAMRRV